MAAAQRGAGITLPAPALISLSRRNRLKHALSRYVRGRPSLRLQQRQQLDHGGPRPGGPDPGGFPPHAQPQPGVRVQPASLLKLLGSAAALVLRSVMATRTPETRTAAPSKHPFSQHKRRKK